MSKNDIKNIDQSNPYEISSIGGDNLRKFSDELLEKYKGKVLEIFLGDVCETLNFEEFSIPQNCIIYCKLLNVLDRFIEVQCYYMNANKQVSESSPILINAFQIRVMTELNGQGCLNDIFLSSKSADKVRKAIQHIK